MKNKFFTPQRFLLVFLTTLGLIIPWTQVYAVYNITKSPDKIEGSNSESNLRFSSILTRENSVSISIEWDGKRILAEIDYDNKELSLHSIDTSNNKPVVINKKDKEVLEAIKDQLPQGTSLPEDALMSTLNLAIEYPTEEVMNYDSQKTRGGRDTQSVSPQALSDSLCDRVGEIVTGQYTVENLIPGKQCIKHTRQVRGRRYVYYECQESVQVGPCWNYENACLGRCGRGCDEDNETVQRFTQNCLNHDLCRGATGQNHGPCHDEWVAAADDFFFAEDCGNVTGQWQDNYFYIWDLKQKSSKLSGEVLVQNSYLQCSTWDVSGTHKGPNIKLKATNPPPIETGCCTGFKYDGKADSCNTARGNWNNECGLSGSWFMYRTGSRVSISTTIDDASSAEVSPASDGANVK